MPSTTPNHGSWSAKVVPPLFLLVQVLVNVQRYADCLAEAHTCLRDSSSVLILLSVHDLIQQHAVNTHHGAPWQQAKIKPHTFLVVFEPLLPLSVSQVMLDLQGMQAFGQIFLYGKCVLPSNLLQCLQCVLQGSAS